MSIIGVEYYPAGGTNNLCCLVLVKSDTVPATKKISPPDTFYTVYLTFDDGPVNESEEVVTIASRDSIPVNLFVVGEKVFANDTMTKLFHSYFNNPFIEIGNHSFTHAIKKYQQYYKNTENVIADFKM